MVLKTEEKKKITLTVLSWVGKKGDVLGYNEMVNYVAISQAFAPMCDIKADNAFIFR